MKMLLILNDPPYGTERSYKGLRLAMSLAGRDGRDAVSCATAGQPHPLAGPDDDPPRGAWMRTLLPVDLDELGAPPINRSAGTPVRQTHFSGEPAAHVRWIRIRPPKVAAANPGWRSSDGWDTALLGWPVGAGVWGIRAVTRQPRSGGGALEIMRQRLAAGEQVRRVREDPEADPGLTAGPSLGLHRPATVRDGRTSPWRRFK